LAEASRTEKQFTAAIISPIATRRSRLVAASESVICRHHDNWQIEFSPVLHKRAKRGWPAHGLAPFNGGRHRKCGIFSAGAISLEVLMLQVNQTCSRDAIAAVDVGGVAVVDVRIEPGYFEELSSVMLRKTE